LQPEKVLPRVTIYFTEAEISLSYQSIQVNNPVSSCAASDSTQMKK